MDHKRSCIHTHTHTHTSFPTAGLEGWLSLLLVSWPLLLWGGDVCALVSICCRVHSSEPDTKRRFCFDSLFWSLRSARCCSHHNWWHHPHTTAAAEEEARAEESSSAAAAAAAGETAPAAFGRDRRCQVHQHIGLTTGCPPSL